MAKKIEINISQLFIYSVFKKEPRRKYEISIVYKKKIDKVGNKIRRQTNSENRYFTGYVTTSNIFRMSCENVLRNR